MCGYYIVCVLLVAVLIPDRYDLGISGSVGQYTHLPGQKKGFVNTVMTMTPDEDRTSFLARKRTSRGFGWNDRRQVKRTGEREEKTR